MLNSNSKLARAFWEKGKLDDCPVIDFHGHMGEWGGGYMPRMQPEGMLKTMDQCNIRLILFCGHEALNAPCTEHQLDIDAVRAHPDRFRAYFALNGNAPDQKKIYQRFLDHQDVFVGLKSLPDYFHHPISSDVYAPFYEYVNEHHLPYLSHTWGGSKWDGVAEAEKFMKKYPDVTLIAGHSFHSEWLEATRLCNDYPNLYLELTAVLDDRGPLELFVEKCGSVKILFGTDLPWFDSHHGIGTVLSADLTDDDRRNIFYRNGQRLLGKFQWFNDLWKPLD